jgi:hypothetical protein
MMTKSRVTPIKHWLKCPKIIEIKCRDNLENDARINHFAMNRSNAEIRKGGQLGINYPSLTIHAQDKIGIRI